MWDKLNSKLINIYIVKVRAPTLERNQNEFELFYGELSNVFRELFWAMLWSEKGDDRKARSWSKK